MAAIPALSHILALWAFVDTVGAERIAEKKCREYRNLTVIRTGIIPLIARPVPIVHEEFNCSNTVDVIVGGEEAQHGEFPHQALLGWRSLEYIPSEEYIFLCGAVLISEWYVMTAGHCIADGTFGQPDVVRLGEHDLDNDYDHGVDFYVDRAVRHPLYRGSSIYNDIALVKVKREVRFSSFIRPACLWTSRTINYTMAIATGFGQLGFLGEPAKKLNKVKLELYEPWRCNWAFERNRKFKEGMVASQICAGSDGNRDTCKGDSGGPLQVMVEEKGCTYHVIGLTSRGQDACGWSNPLAIYTRVSSFVSWIEQIVWGEEWEEWK